jgi:hypothetical protein
MTVRRLLDSGDAPPEVLELLRQAKKPASLHSAARERSVRRVAALIAIPAAASTLSWVTYAAYGAALGAAVTAAVAIPDLIERRHEPTAPISSGVHAPPRVSAPARAKASPLPLVVPEVTPQALPSPTLPPSVGHREVHVVADAEAPSLTREASLLAHAQRILPTDPAAALASLRQHQLEFPHGVLEPEREMLVVDALMRLGRRQEASARAKAIRSRSPNGLYSLRLEKLLSERSSAGR